MTGGHVMTGVARDDGSGTLAMTGGRMAGTVLVMTRAVRQWLRRLA
jgi:hypothetical protein